MACLGSIAYDPAAAVSKSLGSALAMTVIDSVNARVTFTVPASGKVLVRLACVVEGGGATPWVSNFLLGVISSTPALVRREVPIVAPVQPVGSTTAYYKAECSFVVSGLTPGGSLSWDMAYGVETGVASCSIKYGGPNDTTVTNAFGPVVMEVWDA